MKRIIFLLAGLCLNTGVMAATVWAPSNPNGDVNVLLTTYYSGDGILALFDDQNQNYSAPGLVLNNNDTVTFSTTSSGYVATSGVMGGSIVLSETYNFILGMSLDGGATWIADTFSVALTGGNAYQVYFGNAGQTLIVDVQAVPLPAAVWLFGSALLGMIGLSRRNKIRITTQRQPA